MLPRRVTGRPSNAARRPPAFRLVLVAMSAALAPGVTGYKVSGAEPTAPSAKEIASTIRTSMGAIHSLHVKYSICGVPAFDLRPSSGQVAQEVADSYDQGLFRIRDDYAFSVTGDVRKYYRMRRAWEPADARLQRTTWRESWVGFDGQALRSMSTECTPPETPKTRGASVSGNLSRQSFETMNLYMEGIGSPFYDGEHLDVRARPSGAGIADAPKEAFSLAAALEAQPYRVREDLVDVDGVRCRVVAAGDYDTAWLDPARNYALVRREWRYHGGPVMYRWNNSGFQEAAPGVWLPTVVRREAMTYPRNGSTKSALLLTNHCEVVDLAVNNVPDPLFVVNFPAGTTVGDSTILKEADGQRMTVLYTVGATPESTEQNLKKAIGRRNRDYEAVHSQGWKSLLMLGLNLAVGAVLLGFIIVRRWGKRQAGIA